MRRVLNILFGLFVALVLLVLGVWLVLGLAAAGPSHTGLPQLAAFFAVPTLLLAAVVWLYLRGPWAAARPLATVLAAVPAVGVAVGVAGTAPNAPGAAMPAAWAPASAPAAAAAPAPAARWGAWARSRTAASCACRAPASCILGSIVVTPIHPWIAGLV